MTTYMQMAKEAIDQVRNIQSANTAGAMTTDWLGVTQYGQCVGLTQAQQGPTYYNQHPTANANYAAKVEETQAGNCADKAIVAYLYLFRTHFMSAHFAKCNSVGFDHAFLVIHNSGKIEPAPGRNFTQADFGDDAVLVDAWQHDYYHLNGYPSINPRSWLVGPQQGTTRFNIWKNPIHVTEGAAMI